MPLFMKQTTIAIQLPPPLLTEIDEVARKTARARAEVVRSYLRRGLATDGDQKCETCALVRKLVSR